MIGELHSVAARRVGQERLRVGLSQERLAQRAGLSRETVRNVEHGRTDFVLRTLERIAQALDVEPSTLLQELPS